MSEFLDRLVERAIAGTDEVRPRPLSLQPDAALAVNDDIPPELNVEVEAPPPQRRVQTEPRQPETTPVSAGGDVRPPETAAPANVSHAAPEEFAPVRPDVTIASPVDPGAVPQPVAREAFEQYVEAEQPSAPFVPSQPPIGPYMTEPVVPEPVRLEVTRPIEEVAAEVERLLQPDEHEVLAPSAGSVVDPDFAADAASSASISVPAVVAPAPVPAIRPVEEVPAPSIQVTIGRIEVRAVLNQPPQEAPPAPRPDPWASLDAYLSSREVRR